MHYYQFNIGDYRRDTSHLSHIEHYIYRTLIDNYYLSESPIPKETQLVSRRLCLGCEQLKNLENVLADFFVLEEDGYHHKRIDEDIVSYHSTANKNRINGKNGGRPKKQQLTDENKPKKTQSVILANPTESQKKPNQEPITNNQEPITNNQEPITNNQELFFQGQDQKPLHAGKKPPAATGAIWDAYSSAYQDRYGVAPVRNAMVSGQLSQFLKRIPEAEAPHIAAFFVSHNNGFYVTKLHPVGLLLADAEKLRTEWATCRQMTATRARQVDEKQTNFDVVAEALRLDKLEGRA